MSRIRLSICISTLNRATFIGETLESILTQATDEVEVIVFDAASTDRTPAVMKEFAARYPQLRYVRLEQSMEADQKYRQAVAMSQGEYCWLFTDDDLLKPGTVAAVLEAARKQYSLIIVNAEVRDANLAACVEPRRLNIQADRVYSPAASDRDHLLADTGAYVSFLGALLMRREVWDQRDKAKYAGIDFIHTSMIFQGPMPGDTLVMAHPWITIRAGNGSWYSRSFEIWMFTWPYLIWSYPGFAEWARARVVPREPWRDLRRLLLDRAMGRYSLNEYGSLLRPRLKHPLPRLLSRCIATLPIPPLNLLARLYVRLVLRKVPSIALYELEVSRKQLAASR